MVSQDRSILMIGSNQSVRLVCNTDFQLYIQASGVSFSSNDICNYTQYLLQVFRNKRESTKCLTRILDFSIYNYVGGLI